MNVHIGLDGTPFAVVCLVKMTVMAAFVLLLMWATRNHSAHWRVNVARLGFLAILAMPVFDAVVPGFSVLPALARSKTVKLSDWLSAGIPDSDVVCKVNDGTDSDGRLTAWLGAVWIAGCGVVGARMFVQTLRLRMADREGIPTAREPLAVLDEIRQQLGCRYRIDLQTSTSASTPYVRGVFKPVIVVPKKLAADADETTWKAILAHEVTHVCRWDLRWDAAFNLACILTWWHPLVWRLRSEHGRACEEVCDAVASRCVASVSTYCRILARVAVAGANRPVPALGMARTSNIIRRLSSLRHDRNSLDLSWVATVCVWLIVLLPAAGLAR
jgi:beta-lactamase regulating signal transducer with metallopeptidase domain